MMMFALKRGLCIKNEELCVKNEELCIKNEEFCIKNDGFCRTTLVLINAWMTKSAASGGPSMKVSSTTSELYGHTQLVFGGPGRVF